MIPFEKPSDFSRAVAQGVADLLEGVDAMSPRLAREIQLSIDQIERIYSNGSNTESSVRKAIESALKRREADIQFDRMSAGLFADLLAAGFDPPSIEWMREPQFGNLRALPILLDWFDTTEQQYLKLKILDGLGTWAFPTVIPLLFERFHRIDPESDDRGLRYHILEIMAPHIRSADRHEWAEIAADPAQVDVRPAALEGLSFLRKRPDDLVDFVTGFLVADDPLTAAGAAAALRRWRVVEALPRIELLHDEIAASYARTTEANTDLFILDRLKDAIRALRVAKAKSRPPGPDRG